MPYSPCTIVHMKKIQGYAKNSGRRINMKFSQVMIAPPVPAHESAWERGLRQAKEMRRRSSKRKETDVEYEEKKASLSLTQVGDQHSFSLNHGQET